MGARKRRSKGSGTVYERGGAWCYQVDFGRLPNGKRDRRTRSGYRSENAARTALETELRMRDTGEWVEPSRMTVREFVDDHWLPSLLTLADTTRDVYRANTRAYILPNLGEMRLQDLTADHLVRLYELLLTRGGRKKQGLAPKTVRNVAADLHVALEYAVSRGWLAANPAARARVPKGRRDSTRPRHWTARQVRSFLAADVDLADLWVVAAVTGMRRGELLGLRRADFGDGAVRVAWNRTAYSGKVREGPTKTGEVRTIPLPAQAVDAVGRHLDEREAMFDRQLEVGGGRPDPEHLFTDEAGEPYDPRWVSDQFIRDCAAAGVEPLRPRPLHGLRHTATTLLLEAGVEPHVVSWYVGHRVRGTTLSVYAHPTVSAMRPAAEAMEEILGY